MHHPPQRYTALTRRAMLHPALLGGRGWGFGTSVVLNGPWAGVFGWDGGLGTSFLVDRRETSP